MDRDIQGGLANLKMAEGIVGHQWKGIDGDKYANPAKKVDYNFAPALDANIVDSQNNLKNTETKMNHQYQLLQLETESDPICSSAGCDQYKHPERKDDWDRNYFVPHFGMDRNMQDNFEDLAMAEKIVGHHWVGIDKDKYSNPARDVDYNFAPALDSDMIDAQKNQVLAEKQLDHVYELD